MYLVAEESVKRKRYMKRMLVITPSMDQGGAETFLMKVYRALDKKKYQFDFYIMGNKGFYDGEIISLGGRITYAPMKTKGFFKYRSFIKAFFKSNNYEYIYRAVSTSLATLDLFYAKKYGNPKRIIARSTNSNVYGKIAHYAFRPFMLNVSNAKIAPSTEAAMFMFGKRSVKMNKVSLLMNGIDTSLFSFMDNKRTKSREGLGIKSSETLFIHIGRFTKQKNHSELAVIFKEILMIDNNSRLLCVGDGRTKGNFIRKCKDLNVLERVIFLEQRSDINELLMAADIMLLPSLFEGLPNVVMEAQATGLPCLVSDNVTKECDVTNLVYFEKLGNPGKWASQSLKISNSNMYLREENAKKFPEKYDINQIAERFVNIVFEDENK